MSPPLPDDVGKLWDERDLVRPFCSIGDPRYLRALMAVTPSDNRLLHYDRQQLKARGGSLSATIRVHGHGERTWTSNDIVLYDSEAQQLPVQLTVRGGGDIAIKPSSQPESYAPVAQVYQVAVNFDDPEQTISPGTMGQVKIHCQWRTAAWWGWRAFASMFDLGMDPTDLVPFVPRGNPAGD
jgi:putative peptide zinc metalloprotease protein